VPAFGASLLTAATKKALPMKTLSLVILLLTASAPALAQSDTSSPSQPSNSTTPSQPSMQSQAPAQAMQASGQKGFFTCWYSGSGKLTGSTPAPANTPARSLILTGRGGDQSWAYAIHSDDGHDCPTYMPSNHM
jgi:hypothetical protein